MLADLNALITGMNLTASFSGVLTGYVNTATNAANASNYPAAANARSPGLTAQ